jgi:deazaflavin-dependent oxidoreductase (nitroreductase family)
MNEVMSRELAVDPTVDITTTGARSGALRRIEIWMLDVGGRYFVTGTPGRRDWLANLRADPTLVVHLKRHALVDLPAVAVIVDEESTRRDVFEHESARWYRGQHSVDELVDDAPMVEITFPA